MACFSNLNLEEIGVSRTIPARFYTESEVLENEKKHLFYKNWHYAGHRHQLDSPGKYLAGKLFDQEYFLICDQQDEIRAFYNVCQHRAHQLVKGQGQKRVIVCPYHRWTYDYSGRLVGARGCDREQTFQKNEICLSSIQVDYILDFVFINFDPNAPPLSEYAAGIEAQILDVVPDIKRYHRTENVDYFGGAYNCNWKVMIDNFLECYHCESAHESFSDIMDIKRTRYRFHEYYSYQIIPSTLKADNKAFPLDIDEDVLDGHFWYIYPNIIFTVFPGVKNLSVSRCEPDGPERTLRFFDVYAPDDVNQERQRLRAEWGMNVVNEEDKTLCESVQKGLRQNGFNQGHYLIDPGNGSVNEEAVKFFHHHYANSLGLHSGRKNA